MGSFRRDKDDEDEGINNVYHNLEKTSVLQETRTFNETPVNAKKCTAILTKILYLINQGEVFTAREATDCFFATTKLFQSKDVVLRRMVYLGIKELSTVAEDVIIVTSSLTKDMTGKEDLYRAAAIRALCSITEASMLQSVERYMKQCIVDKNSAVSCAALVSSLHLTAFAWDAVKRWAHEAQESLNSEHIMVQYHALGLLYHLRKNDRLAASKLVNKLARHGFKSVYGVCMLIRIACKLIEDESSSSKEDITQSPYFDFIESCLRHKSEMVTYEAAHAIVNLRHTNARILAPAFSILQLFCSSPKATLRFAAVRTLNRAAMSHPATVTSCNLDLESLITDSNRSVATLAITTLLKTGAESSVERLMKQISSFVAEIPDEFKVVVVQAISSLCSKYPRKHSVLMNFLSGMLREEGGVEYKTSIIDTIITIIEENIDAKESGLSHLCEFIEDCEHTSLAVRILHLLGKEGINSTNPSKYIRFIYNRVILENAIVRAAAVAALAQFGAGCPELSENILVLLVRCQMDPDDEVRDRATYYYNILCKNKSSLCKPYVTDKYSFSLPLLEKSLLQRINGNLEGTFDLSAIPQIIRSHYDVQHEHMYVQTFKKPIAAQEKVNTDQLKRIPGFEMFGPICKSCIPVELTESETEYTVQCIKHIFQNCIVLQFDCLNTLPDVLLENVRVSLTIPEGFYIQTEVPCSLLPFNKLESVLVLIQFPEDLSRSFGSCSAILKFSVKDCDPESGMPECDDGYGDEYILEDFEITVADQIKKNNLSNFISAWENAGEQGYVEFEDTYALASTQSLQDAVDNILKYLGMNACDMTENVVEEAHTHTLQCAGIFRNGSEILLQAKLALADFVTMHLVVRSTCASVAGLVMSAIG